MIDFKYNGTENVLVSFAFQVPPYLYWGNDFDFFTTRLTNENQFFVIWRNIVLAAIEQISHILVFIVLSWCESFHFKTNTYFE
jgi:hypothetical protein